MMSEKIKELRNFLGLSVHDFACRVGCSRDCAYNWERGETLPRGHNLLALWHLAREVNFDF